MTGQQPVMLASLTAIVGMQQVDARQLLHVRAASRDTAFESPLTEGSDAPKEAVRPLAGEPRGSHCASATPRRRPAGADSQRPVDGVFLEQHFGAVVVLLTASR